MNIIVIFIICSCFSQSIKSCSDDCYTQAKNSHHLKGVSDKELDILENLIKFRSNLKQIFKNINIIRPVGSRNHEAVKEYIKSYLKNLQWTVEEDKFEMDTVIGNKEFTNIFATQNTTKSRRLILACHYDSLSKEGFYGSTDSALPCSLMISIAEILQPFLRNYQDIDVSLQLIFFDGEEAFIQWNKRDSIYGSRHLANLWDNDRDRCQCSKLERIDSLILLDLLGAERPKFYNFNYGNRYFDSMLMLEKRIRNRYLFKDNSGHPYFQSYMINTVMEDDHVPFMEKNVPYVHLIAVPFPAVWHTIADNADNISWEVSKDLELILTVFLVEYFHIPVHDPNTVYESLQSAN